MLSTCPSCLNQIQHADHLSEITCECGVSFPTVLHFDEAEVIPTALETDALSTLAAPTADFSESNSVFQELRAFGEGVELGSSTPVPPPTTAEALPPSKETTGSSPGSKIATTAATPPESSFSITHGDSFTGFEIAEYLSPISVWSELSPQESDPLAPGFRALEERARELGADAIVAVRWSFTAEGNRLVLSGTPVRWKEKLA